MYDISASVLMPFLGRLLNGIRVHLFSPTGILCWIIASTIQGHSRAVTSHKVKYDLVKSFKELNFFFGKKSKE